MQKLQQNHHLNVATHMRTTQDGTSTPSDIYTPLGDIRTNQSPPAPLQTEKDLSQAAGLLAGAGTAAGQRCRRAPPPTCSITSISGLFLSRATSNADLSNLLNTWTRTRRPRT